MHPPDRRSPQSRRARRGPSPLRRHAGPGRRRSSVRDGGSAHRVGGTEPWSAPAHGVAITCRSAAAGPGPILLILAAVAGVAYGWRMGSSIEIYYAAAARSMSASWHDFAYGAFDPGRDHLGRQVARGAVDPSAVCPALRGSTPGPSRCPKWWRACLTVLVLYRVVRRLAGAERRHRRSRSAGRLPGCGHPRSGQHL